MKCPCCGIQMVKRNGVFGEFFSCRQHGTMSLNKGKLRVTGEIYKKFKTRLVLSLSQIGNCVIDSVSLEHQMQKQMIGLGVQMNEIDRFIEGETLELMQMNADDDENHWLNTRPY